MIITFIAKIIVHNKYLDFRDDAYFTGPSPILDALLPQKKRAEYVKLYISMLWFPILSKEGDQKLKSITNYLILFLYLLIGLLIAIPIYMYS
jgi:hypothetical protein